MKLLSDPVPAKLSSSQPYAFHLRPPLLRREIEILKGVPHLLTWGNVDLKRRIVSFRKTKSGKVRHVPINPDLYAVLMHLEPAADPTVPVFPPEWNTARVAVAFQRVAQRAGLKGFRFHDLRHDFCSWLTMRGVPMRAVQQLAGHSDMRMTQRYSHLAEQVLVEAVQALPALPMLPANGSGHGDDAALRQSSRPRLS